MSIPKPITYHQWNHPEEYILAESQELFDNILFPLAQRIANRTIDLDLVQVQPMAAPQIDVLPWLYFDVNPAHPRTIVEHIPKPLLYKKWKQQQAIIKKWKDSGILEGVRGNQFEPGYAYAAYIPVVLTPEVICSPNFNPNRAIRSRYAISLANNNFYDTVRIVPEEE